MPLDHDPIYCKPPRLPATAPKTYETHCQLAFVSSRQIPIGLIFALSTCAGAEQIVIPPDLGDILKAYAKEVIRNEPEDIYEFSAK